MHQLQAQIDGWSGLKAGIIIVTYQSARFLPRLLEALACQTTRNWRLALVDNASRPEERPIAGDLPPDTHFIQLETNIGFAAANNLAARTFDDSVDCIVCLNPDAFPEADWLAQLIAAATRYPKAASFGSLQLLDSDPTCLDGAGDVMTAYGVPYRGGYLAPRSTLPDIAETFSACAAAALYRRAVFAAAGGFDEDFFGYCEDVDLGYRFRLQGWTCLQINTAIVRHVSGGSASRASAFALRHGARNRLWTYLKNTPAPVLLLTILPHLLITGAAMLAHALAGRSAGLTGFWDGLRGLPHLLRKRRQTQAERTASLSAIATALAWNPMRLLTRAPDLRQVSDEPVEADARKA